MLVREAEESLQIIRDLMERSTKFSTFSGLSGIFAGSVSIAGCLSERYLVRALPSRSQPVAFLANWALVVLLAIGMDYLLTKRRAVRVGKTVVSRLGRQMAMASLPGLGVGVLLTFYFLHQGLLAEVYPFWMLAYGVAVCAVGLFSQREVTRLGWAFLASGAAALAVQMTAAGPVRAEVNSLLMAITFGGYHIVYGITVARRHGW